MISSYPTIHQDHDFYHDVASGEVPGHSLMNKFGAGDVGTSIVPVTNSLVYQTPTAAQSLEFVSSSANDTATGVGAREITIQGLDSNWDMVTLTIATNGTTAVSLPTDLVRLFRWTVSGSGTYATQTAGSHAGTLTVRAAGGGATWATIPSLPFPFAQSEIGVYTVPRGYTGYLISRDLTTDTSKSLNAYLFQRPNADTVVAPYSSMRVVERFVGVNAIAPPIKASKGPFVGPCDIGFMAEVSVGSAVVSVNFTLLLVEDGY